MRYGSIVQYFPAKGFGFIRPDMGPDIFFHITAIGACQPEPKIEPGQAVKYELVPGTEPKRKRRRDSDEPEQPVRPQAKFVELIDRIPGAAMVEQKHSPGHPKARHKKPTWRR